MIILNCDFVLLYLNDVIYWCLDDSMDRAVGTRHSKTFFKRKWLQIWTFYWLILLILSSSWLLCFGVDQSELKYWGVMFILTQSMDDSRHWQKILVLYNDYLFKHACSAKVFFSIWFFRLLKCIYNFILHSICFSFLFIYCR